MISFVQQIIWETLQESETRLYFYKKLLGIWGSQTTLTCLKSTMETPEQCVKPVQS